MAFAYDVLFRITILRFVLHSGLSGVSVEIRMGWGACLVVFSGFLDLFECNMSVGLSDMNFVFGFVALYVTSRRYIHSC